MSKGNTFENDFLKLIFNATAIADLAENDTTSPLTDLWVSLHTGDPGEAGSQLTSETTYTGYARVAVARTAGGWTVTGSSVSPVADVTFGECSAGVDVITHAAIGTASAGAGKVLYKGLLSTPIVMAVGVTPKVGAGSTITED